MPKLTIDERDALEVATGRRLINAIVYDAGADQNFSCGGQAKCTTCRVQFVAGEPQRMTVAERDLLAAGKLDQQPGVRLSCQITCESDMQIKLISPKPPAKNPAKPADEIQPPPVWVN